MSNFAFTKFCAKCTTLLQTENKLKIKIYKTVLK